METSIAGIRLDHPIMNAAGPRCKTVEEIQQLARTPVAAVMVGSITWEMRPGNQGEVYFSELGEFSLNSLGLPNGGRDYYTLYLPEMAQMAHQAGKTLWVSVAGFTPEEYANLTLLAVKHGADVVELNLGCPNVWEGGTQKRIASFDPLLVEEILKRVQQAVDDEINPDAPKSFALKVSPYSDPLLLEEVAAVVAKSPLVQALTAINTFPNGFAWKENGKSSISPQFSNGLAGMAGPALKAVALGQVIQWRTNLPRHIDVIGAGGVNSGQDVIDYLNAGAKAVQIATAFADQGPQVFDRILTEFIVLNEFFSLQAPAPTKAE